MTLMLFISQSLRSSIGQNIRLKHSSTQVNRLFKKNPARSRVESRMGIVRSMKPLEPRQFPSIFDAKFLPNGWSAPPPVEHVPDYPFRVARTKNKPNDSVGYLPVYAKRRYVLFFPVLCQSRRRSVNSFPHLCSKERMGRRQQPL